MAHNLKGTFNKSQFDRLVIFLRAQVPQIDARIAHLSAEKLRLGSLTMKFDPNTGVPAGYTADSETSYLGQLLLAYEVLGGDALHDLQIRSITNPVYLLKGSESTPALMMSNGEPTGQKGLADALSAGLMEKAKFWVEDALESRRVYLERKIRRTVDYGDQLENEIALLNRIKGSVESEDSLENTLAEIQQLFGNKLYRAIYDDKGKDPHGKMTHAPFAAYESGGERPSSPGPERGSDGVVLPGEKGS